MIQLQVTIGGKQFTVAVDPVPRQENQYQVVVDGEPVSVTVPQENGRLPELEWVIIDDRVYELTCNQALSWIKDYSGHYPVEVRNLATVTTRPPSGDGRIKAPIPGLIARVLVEPGTKVSINDPVLVLEAMKMENEIRATTMGTVQAVHVAPGQTVAGGEVLIDIV